VLGLCLCEGVVSVGRFVCVKVWIMLGIVFVTVWLVLRFYLCDCVVILEKLGC
jgi:hypothetical protein